MQQLQSDLNGPVLPPLQPGESLASSGAGMFSPNRLPATIAVQTVEVYPYIEYIKYLLAGSISLSIFVTAMIGGGITFIDDKARGLHEGYLSHAAHQGGTGAGTDRLGRHQGADGRTDHHDHRRLDCRNSAALGPDAAVLLDSGSGASPRWR